MKTKHADFETVAIKLGDGGLEACQTESPKFLINLTGPHNETLLHFFAVENRPDLVSQLAGIGAAIDVENEFGNTPLMETTILGNIDMVRCLLKIGATPAHQSSMHKSTALHFAIEHRKPEVAKLLIEHGSPLNLPNQYGETATELLLSNGYQHLLESGFGPGTKVTD